MTKKKLGSLVSSGKDSIYALYLLHQQGHEISCILNMRSKNQSSYMFHSPNVHLVELQAEAMDIPLSISYTEGKKEEELVDLKAAIKKAVDDFGIEGITTGALASDYQRERIEKIGEELGIEVISPLWHMDQEAEIRAILDAGFTIMLSAVAAHGLDKSWLNRVLTHEDVDNLVKLREKYHINVGGEGGEFESLVLDCPLFKRKLEILETELVEEDEHTANVVVKKAQLTEKSS